MKNLKIIFISLILLFQENIYSQQIDQLQNIHKYLTFQAWELIKHEHPEVINSEMNLRIGNWQDGSINGTGPWQKGKVMTGSYREDEEDVVYKHSGLFVSATHFWDADLGDYTTFNPPPYTYNYANSYQKILAYWFGNVSNNAWLELGPFFYNTSPYYIKVKYNNLSEAYRDKSNFLVTHWYDISTQSWVAENPPQPVIPYLMENSPGYSQAEAVALMNRVSWETIGRIAHHIADMGVPAHAHNDPHPVSDYYEDDYMPAHFQEFTWNDALNQGGSININNKLYPLRFSLYTTNQIADRFRSDDACGDQTFPYPSQYISENYESVLNPVYQSIEHLNIGVCDGPQSIANTVAQNTFVYSIRSTAGFLWYVYNQFGIQTQLPPVIHGFSTNLPDNTIYHGETLTLTCNASGSNLNYNWFYKICNINNWCTLPVNGLSFGRNNNVYSVSNNNFSNRWTCSLYDSLCNAGTGNSEYSENPLQLFLGVTVSNQFAQVTNYYNLNNPVSFSPYNGIRPSNPPVSGCPFLYTYGADSMIAENNILHRSTFPGYENMDIKDKIVISENPILDTSGNVFSFAIDETSNDIDYFNSIRLIEVDHHKDYKLLVTENTDLALMKNSDVQSPDHAEINEMDVTQILKFDSDFENEVKGMEKDIINLEFKPDKFAVAKQRFTEELLKANFKLESINDIKDSIAIILDPSEPDHSKIPIQKRPAGYISITDTSGIKVTDDIDFARRIYRSMITIPILSGNKISKAGMVFKSGFDLSYCAAAKIFYGGYIENQLELVGAENSVSGDILKKLLKDDKEYAEMDSTSFITLKFKYTDRIIPKDWVRDYVMIINGRTVVPENSKYKSPDENSLHSVNVNLLPDKTELYQNYPNPFNPVTDIKYYLPKDQFTELTVYDLLGKEIGLLVNERQNAGMHSVRFNAVNLPSGIYYYKINSDGFTMVRKMIILK